MQYFVPYFLMIRQAPCIAIWNAKNECVAKVLSMTTKGVTWASLKTLWHVILLKQIVSQVPYKKQGEVVQMALWTQHGKKPLLNSK